MNQPEPPPTESSSTQPAAKKRKMDQSLEADPATLGKSINMFEGLGESTGSGFENMSMSMSMGPNMFSMSSSSSDFWKILEPDDLQQHSHQTAEFQQRLKNLEEEPPQSIKIENYTNPISLYNSQSGEGLGFSQGSLLGAVGGAPLAPPPMNGRKRGRILGEEDEEREEEEEEQVQSSGGRIPSMHEGGYVQSLKSEFPPHMAYQLDQPPHAQQQMGSYQYHPYTTTTTTATVTASPPDTTVTTPPSTTAPAKGKRKGRGRAPKQQQQAQQQPQQQQQQHQAQSLQAQQHAQQMQQFHQQMQQQLQRTTPALMLVQIANVEKSIENQLKAMRFHQRKVIDNFTNREEVEKLMKSHADVRKQIDTTMLQLEHINANHILPTPDAWNLIRLLELFQVHSKRLAVLQEEFFMVQSNPTRPPAPVALLLITKQPFPCTVKQSKSVDETVEVQAITGSKVDIQGQCIIQAELINEDYNPVVKKKNAAPAIQNGEEPLDENGVATFKRLTFPHGSRVKSVNMRFAADFNLAGQSLRVLSEPSRPFIVMTNHGQRSTTEGKLLKKHIFFSRSEIEWPAFANAMQLHYIRATKQDPMKPTRPLSLKDLEYLHITKFQGRPYVSQDDYDGFWAWFGTILYKIRNHQKHILPMWIKGLIYGFLSREDSDRLLQTQTAIPGSFLVRFSDRCAGQFVVVYVSQGKDDPNSKVVTHYLVKPEDIEKKSTLPDFLRDCENLWYLLQVVRDPETGIISLRPRNKDEVMAPYYTRERSQPLPYGYDTRQP